MERRIENQTTYRITLQNYKIALPSFQSTLDRLCDIQPLQTSVSFNKTNIPTTMLERPPPHSIQAISGKRKGGKKVPKKYRKYHTAHTSQKDKKTGGHIAVKAFTIIRKVVGGAMSSLP